MGGAGSAVSECLATHGITTPLLHLGLPDHFVEQGSREEILSLCGLDKGGIIRAVVAQGQGEPCQTAATHVNS